MEWVACCEAVPWPARARAAALALPSGAVLLLGGLTGPRHDVWHSRDRGATWQQLPSPPWSARSGHCAAALASGRIVLLAGASDTGLQLGDVWCSDDEGTSWRQLAVAKPWPARSGGCLLALADDLLLLLGGSGPGGEPLNDVWRSADGGASWEMVLESAPWPARTWAAAAACGRGASGPATAVLLGGLAAGDRLLDDVWRSEDGGENWELVADCAAWGPRRSACAVVVDGAAAGVAGDVLVLLGGLTASRNFTRLAAAGPLSDIWASPDGGASWARIAQEAPWPARLDHNAVALADGAVLVLGGSRGDEGAGGHLNDVWIGTPVGASSSAAAAPVAQPPPPSRPRPPASAAQGASAEFRPQPPPPQRPPPARGSSAANSSTALPSMTGGPQPKAAGSRAGSKESLPGAAGGLPRYEDMAAPDLRRAILALQKGLADITRRMDSVGMENHLLREENLMLKEAIDDKIEGSR